VTLFVAWIAFPLVLAVLAAGTGALIARLARVDLPGPLVLPLGVAGLIVLVQPLTASDATAELGVPVAVAAAVAGLVVSRPWRRPGPLDPWTGAAAVGVFAVYAAPVVLSGEATFAGYLRLDDTASWLALTDRVLEHGATTTGLAPSSYEAALDFYLNSSYPLGTFLPLGVGSRLVGQDAAWLYQPYIAFLGAMLALCLSSLVAAAAESRPLRAAIAFFASQPALTFGYALWGGAKEMAAAGLLALASALVVPAVRGIDRVGAVAPLAVACAAVLGVLSSGGVVWVLPILCLGLLAAIGTEVSHSALATRGGGIRWPPRGDVAAPSPRHQLP